MKTSRKIWSIPIAALALVLMLAGGMLATGIVQAQEANAAPTVANPIDDQELMLSGVAGASGNTEATVDLSDVFNDAESDALAFTIMTSNAKRAEIDTVTYDEAPVGGVVATWWNNLSQADRQAVIGLTDDDLDSPDTSTTDTCEDTDWCGEYTPATPAGADEIDGIGLYNDEDVENISSTAKKTVTQAFHWNMLSGPQMYVAAKAGGLASPSDYMKPFAGLTMAERLSVEGLYDTVLLRGQLAAGTELKVEAGAAGTDEDGDGRADNVGVATITVKVSDAAGRLIPPGDGSTTVGDEFDVNVTYHPLEPLEGIVLEGVEGNSTVKALDADGNIIVEDADVNSTASYMLIVNDGAKGEIAKVTIADMGERDPHKQLINYSLKNGAGLPYYIDGGDGAKISAPISIKPDATPMPASFTIQVNEEGNSSNRVLMDVEVHVAEGNSAPVFDDAALAALTGNVKILEHMENEVSPNVIGAPINFGAHALDGDNQKLSYSLSPEGKGLKINPATGELEADGMPAVDFDEMDATANEVEFTVTVSDGTLSDSYSFTGMITTNKATANTGLENVTAGDTPGTASVSVTVGTEGLGVPQDGHDILVVDLETLLNPIHSADGIEFNLVGPIISPFGLDGSVLQLEFVPDARPTYMLEFEATVTADDGYDDEATGSGEAGDVTMGTATASAPDLTMTITVTVYVEAPPTVSAFRVSEMVYENAAGVDIPGTADLYTATGITPFYHYLSGTGAGEIAEDGTSAFSVDTATGQVTLDVAQDFEDGMNEHSLTIFIRDEDEAGPLLSVTTVAVEEMDVNEAPMFADDLPMEAMIDEDGMSDRAAMADGAPLVIMATDPDADDVGANYSISPSDAPFSIDASGAITANGMMEADETYSLTITATDRRDAMLMDTHMVTITVDDVNEAPSFTEPTGEELTITIDEDLAMGEEITTFKATDPDAGETLRFSIRDEADKTYFSIGAESGVLSLLKELDYEDKTELEAHVVVTDHAGLSDRVKLIVNVGDVNDHQPMFATNMAMIDVMENTPRGTALTSSIAPDGVYMATDGDGTAPNNQITYSINSKSFHIDSSTGMLTTLESLDADTGTPCGATGCHFTITATDGGNPAMRARLNVTVNVSNAEDSVTTFHISKPNPVPGVSMGNPDSALADTKEGMDSINERPNDQPAVEGDMPMNFVEADWASWGTVLRIEVTAQSPHADCGIDLLVQTNNNQCVLIDIESDSAGNKLQLEAYRSASKENRFVAAVMLVEENPTDDGDGKPGDRNAPVHKDTEGGVVRLETDEEDEVTFRLVNSTSAPIPIDVENEAPEFNNFMPEHEAAFDDGDVEYSFTVTDPVSGIPDPEDLAGDTDGDRDYMPLVALISNHQCHSEDPSEKHYSKMTFAGNELWCRSTPDIRQVVDDRDFDEIDDGFEVSTKIVLPENEAKYVTFIACDNAGNCAMYTPDENDPDEALAEITIDTEDPDLIEARTGVAWDSTDSKYDDDSTFIQLLFDDLTALDPTSIEADDFDVEGHTIKAVHWYDVSDTDDDTAWGDDDDTTTPTRYAEGGKISKRGYPLRQSLRNAVFLELEDELAPDETPDVTIVPNGILDSAGNEQDDDDAEADDWIAPSFTIVSISSPSTPEGSSDQLAGDGDEVTIVLTSDERIQQTRPMISVTHVNAPAGCVNTKMSDEYGRGEIMTGDDCGARATGGTLGTTFERISNTEWIVTVDEPDDTGYYNIYVSGNDRSEQRNEGSEGVAADSIATKFFERDGDVNSDDAHYYQADINLSAPGVRVSGVQIEDTEPTVEFKTPLFVELDFTRPYISDCSDDVDNDERAANCYAESDEYAKDGFDSVTVTSFMLNGTDITDNVKTTDNETFLVAIDAIAVGDHEIEIQAMDLAGNELDKALSVEFEVEERDAFSKRLSPGWNLVSLPGEPADSDISVIFGSDVEVRTVYTYDPIIPGGWMVAVRESLDSDWQGDLTDITARRGYWVLSDAIQDWEVSIPRLAGGAVGSGTPIQPPVIALYAGWNLVPVIDVTGNFAGEGISASAYLQSLDDGLDLARVLGFDTITNTWSTVMAPEGGESDTLKYGKAYWVFVRQAASLVPGN